MAHRRRPAVERTDFSNVFMVTIATVPSFSNLIGMVIIDHLVCHHLSIELKSLIIKIERSLSLLEMRLSNFVAAEKCWPYVVTQFILFYFIYINIYSFNPNSKYKKTQPHITQDIFFSCLVMQLNPFKLGLHD